MLGLMSCQSDMSIGTWNEILSLDGSSPVARHEAAFVKVKDKFYLLGGRDIRSVSIYDTKTSTWAQGVKPPIEIHHFQPIVYDQKIYIIGAFTGGWPNETPVENIMIYDPEINAWSVGDSIPVARRRGAAGATLYNGKFYITCGLQNGHIGGHTNWFDVYDPQTGQWEILEDAPRTRDHFCAIEAQDKLYLLAGRNTTTGDNPFGGLVGKVDYYDFSKKTWNTVPDTLPHLRAGNAAILFHDEILVLGGESDTQELAHNHVDALQTERHTWRSYPSMLQGRHGTGAILKDGKLFVASGCGKRGGEPELTTMECYHIEVP